MLVFEVCATPAGSWGCPSQLGIGKNGGNNLQLFQGWCDDESLGQSDASPRSKCS